MRIRAFTILEILVTIAVTAILVTLVYGAINFLSAQNYREMRAKDRINEWMVMRKQMIEDVYLSNSIIKIEGGMELISGKKDPIIYQVENGVLYLEKNDVRARTKFNEASCSWTIDSNEQEKCSWTVNVMNEPMILSFFAFSTRADRINQWYKTNIAE